MSPHEPQAEGALGTSEAIRQVEMLLRRAADIDSSLVITGESGVGKEVAAKFVHQVSTRAVEPFVAVNCGAIPNELIESQLFGHEKGTFTSALAGHHGYVERARNGRSRVDRAVALSQASRIGVDALFPSEATEGTLAEVRERAEHQHIRMIFPGKRWRPPGQGSPPAPAPMTPDPVRPRPRSGGAEASVEVTYGPPPDAVARRTVPRGKTRDFGGRRRLASRR
jgi:hypothetical protein